MVLSEYIRHVELYQGSMISQSLWVTFPNARFARLEQFLSHSRAYSGIALMAPSDAYEHHLRCQPLAPQGSVLALILREIKEL
jgi:hypothetical protein